MDEIIKNSNKSSPKKECDFFLSYSSDDKEIARYVVKNLEKRGLDIWFAETDLKSSENIYEQIHEAINNSRSCVILLSRYSSVSKPWISKEWAAIQECSWRRPEFKIYLIILENVDTPPFLRSCQAFRTERETTSVSEAVEKLTFYTKLLINNHDTKGETEFDKRETAERFSHIWHLLKEYSEYSHEGADDESK